MNGHKCIPVNVFAGGTVHTTTTEVVYKVDFEKKRAFTKEVVTGAALTNSRQVVCVGHY